MPIADDHGISLTLANGQRVAIPTGSSPVADQKGVALTLGNGQRVAIPVGSSIAAGDYGMKVVGPGGQRFALKMGATERYNPFVFQWSVDGLYQYGFFYAADIIYIFGGYDAYGKPLLKKYSTGGTLLSTIDFSAMIGNNTLMGVCADSSGNIYIGRVSRDYPLPPQSTIYKCTSDGTEISNISFSSHVFRPYNVMTMDSINNLYTLMAEWDSDDLINLLVVKYVDMEYEISFGMPEPATQNDFYGGLDTDASNAWYVVLPTGTIRKYSSAGSEVWVKTPAGKGALNKPSGIAVDKTTGEIYVADTGNNRIVKFTSNLLYLTEWGVYGPGEGEFQSPTDIVIDSSGFVYVLDLQNRCQKFIGRT